MLDEKKSHAPSDFFSSSMIRLLLKRLTVVAEEVLTRCPIVDDLFTNSRQIVGRQNTKLAHNIDECNAGMLIYL